MDVDTNYFFPTFNSNISEKLCIAIPELIGNAIGMILDTTEGRG